MRRTSIIRGGIVAAFLLSATGAVAGPWEDGMVAYNRGDYLPAIHLFRPLAKAGNPKAQSVMGAMYRRGQGVSRSPMRAFMWFSLAARRGDAKARADLRDVSRAMTAEEVSKAREMAEACEASDYRNCEY